MCILKSLFFIITFIISAQASSDSCAVSSPKITGDTFPSKMLLSYGESRKLSLKNYFIGVNLTFTVNSRSKTNITIRSKTQSLTDPYSFKKVLTDNQLGEVVDTLWDDSKVTDLMQNWTDISRIILLTYDNSKETFYLLASSIGKLKPPATPQNYTIIPLKAITPDHGLQISCFRVINVGDMKYYIDCVNFNGTFQQNYFILIEFDKPPPSTYKISYIPNNLVLTKNVIPFPREMRSIKVDNSQYLLRFYNGMEIPNIIYTGIEVWDVTNSKNPNLKLYYNATDPRFPYVTNISSIEVSKSYLYVISSEERVTIVSGWYTTPTEQKVYKFYGMTLRSSNLRIVPTSTGVKESLVVIGSLYSANFAGLLFVSQIYEGYYVIPTPSAYSQTWQFKTNSLSVGEDFFVLSYSIAPNTFANTFCYYLAIFDISTQKSSYCHSLFPYVESNMITYAKMNPSTGTDTLILLGNDNNYQYISIYNPSIQINSVSATEQIELILDKGDETPKIPLEIVVVPRNDPQFILKYSNNLPAFREIASKRNKKAYYPLSNSVCGPNMKFEPTFKDKVKSFSLYGNQQLNLYNLKSPGKLFASSRNDLTIKDSILVITTEGSHAVLNFGRIVPYSEFGIDFLSFEDPLYFVTDLKGYFSIAGFDIFQLEDEYNSQYFYFYNSTLFGLRQEKPTKFNISRVIHSHCESFELLLVAEDQLSISCIDQKALYIIVTNPQANFSVVYSGVIDQLALSGDANFHPHKIKVHPAYPNTVFVLTSTKTNTYVVNYTSPSSPTHQSILSAYKVIFGTFNVTSEDDVFIQPFLNSFFFIVPRQNLIQHWDISNAKASYLRRNLDLYIYDIGILNNEHGENSIAFSSATDMLYLVARNTFDRVLNILVLKPNDANSHLVDAIQIPLTKNEAEGNVFPFIDITTLKQGAFGSTLGDLLCASTVKGFYFWEVYPTPFMTFEPESPPSDGINREVYVSIRAENSWSHLDFDLNFQIYQDEKDLCYSNQSSHSISKTLSSIDFEVNKFVYGTIYNISVETSARQLVSLSSFFNEKDQQLLPVSDVDNAWILKENSYYLASENIIIQQNKGNNTKYVFLAGSLQCTKLYIERTETFGIALCNFSPKTGLRPFNIVKLSNETIICPTIILAKFQGLAIDGYTKVLFILSRDEENDAIIIYEMDSDGCISADPILTIPGWKLAVTDLALTRFDIVYFNASTKTNLIFINDANFGIRIIKFVHLFLIFEQIMTISYQDLYRFYPNLPENLEVLDVSVLDSNCEQPLAANECNISLLIVPKSFHSFLLYFNVRNETNITVASFTSFMVPQDYFVKNYQAAKDIVMLLGTNKSLASPSLDILVYNSSSTAAYYKNNLDQDDYTLYKASIWVYTLIKDINSYEDVIKDSIENVRYPLTFINDETESKNIYELYFPNIQTQRLITYEIQSMLKLSWEKEAFKSFNNLTLKVMNNNEEILFNLFFDKDQNRDLEIILLILGIVLIVSLGIGLTVYYRRKKEKRSLFSRKKQKDPLRLLLVNPK